MNPRFIWQAISRDANLLKVDREELVTRLAAVERDAAARGAKVEQLSAELRVQVRQDQPGFCQIQSVFAVTPRARKTSYIGPDVTILVIDQNCVRNGVFDPHYPVLSCYLFNF